MENNFSKTLALLRKWVKIIEKGLLGLVVFEAVLVLIIGVASSNIYHENYANIYFGILLFTGFLYLLIIAFKVAYNKKVPSSIVDELEAKYKLERIDSDLKRVLSVNKIINETIENISAFDPEVFSEDIVSEGENLANDILLKCFIDTISPFSKNISALFSSNSETFSIGIFFKYKESYKSKYKKIPNPIILRDDFNIAREIVDQIYPDAELKSWQLEFKNFLNSSIINDRYEVSQFKDDPDKKVIICNPTTVDRGFISQKVTLFIVSDKSIDELPFDLESIIRIFSNLISLWGEILMLTTISSGVSGIFKSFANKTKKPKENTDNPAINEPEK